MKVYFIIKSEQEVGCVITREVLIEELLKLPLSELRQVLDMIVQHLEMRGDLELAREVIEQYRPALEELASR